jgi:hypothetical protein
MRAGVSTSSTTGDEFDHGTHLQEETMITGRDILRDGVRVVDVDKERILHQGQPLTQGRVRQLVADARVKSSANLVPGGKSLSGDGRHSPSITVRVPEATLLEIQRRAVSERSSVSKLVRKAVEEYLRG